MVQLGPFDQVLLLIGFFNKLSNICVYWDRFPLGNGEDLAIFDGMWAPVDDWFISCCLGHFVDKIVVRIFVMGFNLL